MDKRDREPSYHGLRRFDHIIKRGFDIVGASIGLFLTWWLILLAYVAASVDTGRSGFFVQERIGCKGELFNVIKIRTMRDIPSVETSVTTEEDPRITALGRFFRKTKIDELPQLINVLLGQMSFVGPRPDVPGFADELTGEDRIILTVRPGITGPASIKFRDEEKVLAQQDDPEYYNRNVIYPEKVRINREYIETYSLWKDIYYILVTVAGR